MALGSATDRWTKVPVPKLRRGIPEETAGSTWVDQDVGLLSYVCSACSINTCLFPANMKCVFKHVECFDGASTFPGTQQHVRLCIATDV